MLKIKYIFLVVLSLWTSQVSQAADAKEDLHQLRREIAKFGANMYKTISAENAEANLVISPFSAHVILSLLYQGASGPTKERLESVLKLSGKRHAAVTYKSLLSDLTQLHNESVSLANSIFVRDGLKLLPRFSAMAKNTYRALAQELNFTDSDAAAQQVNTWISNATNDKITNVIKPADFTNNLLMVVVNALYFKQNWDTPFNVADTRKDKFYLTEKDIKVCDMMSIRLEVPYYESAELDAKIIILPYEEGLLSMMVVLPNEKNGIRSLEEKLMATDFLTLYGMLEFTHSIVDIRIPKFKVEYELDMKPVLEKMDLGIIFERDANFQEICENTVSPYLGKAIQKSFIEVNEHGAEAGSVSAFAILDRIGPAIIKEPFRADHPFMFILSSMGTDVKLHTDVLFIGRVASP